ncbi:MAG TPA: class I SAM-dependent methyltransferase [Solirubrobacterales bacterium]|nr:class I SAM-dependent methyltransferase [Solirubrobacterales bacterium]
MTIVAGVPVDWYRTSFAPNAGALYFEDGGEEVAQLAIQMLELDGSERVLDLACATGRRTLELCREGFDVIGVDVCQGLLEVAGCEAEAEDLLPWFYEEDPRYMRFEREFDVVLSLGGGAFEHFDSDEENLRAFEAAARALRPGGRLLMQTPNVLYVEAHLADRTWFQGGETIELIEQHWNEPTRRLDGIRRTLVEFDTPQDCDPVPFQRRIYTIEELAEIFESLGLHLADVFDEDGRPWSPGDAERELYVEARC